MGIAGLVGGWHEIIAGQFSFSDGPFLVVGIDSEAIVFETLEDFGIFADMPIPIRIKKS